ncbi:hypothetical protein [Francisella sciaenopsi]|uniref:Uncharacterized protein n=1 Tax=Francisella sciaenopsi TaxID=3055034 RepID=A0ABQ6PHQ8_9GAMM
MTTKLLNIRATSDKKDAYFIIIATPTDYDVTTGLFDTSSIETTITDILAINTEAVIVIKRYSTYRLYSIS